MQAAFAGAAAAAAAAAGASGAESAVSSPPGLFYFLFYFSTNICFRRRVRSLFRLLVYFIFYFIFPRTSASGAESAVSSPPGL